MKSAASVAVVVVNWNSGGHLRTCLQALCKQTHQDYSVVVVDNSSTDDSARSVAEMGDPRITLLQLEQNVGFAKANNLGVRASGQTPWVALLNPDAYPEPTWLAELLAAASTYPQMAGFGSRLIQAQALNLSDGTGDAYHCSGRPYRRDHGRSVERSCRIAGEIFSPCAAAALYRRDSWDAAGGLDEDFFCYCEDVDLGFRLRLAGLAFWYVPTALCLHVGSAVTGRRSDFSCYYGQRNLVWTYTKNMPSPLFWLLLPAHFALNLLALAMFTLRGQGAVVWRAKADALGALPEVWKKRRQIQARRVLTSAQLWTLLDKKIWRWRWR